MSSNETDDESRREQVLLTVVPVVAGLAAGATSFVLASGATDIIGVFVLGGFALSSVGIGRITTGRDFSARDYAFMAFLVVFGWFVVWTALLTSTAA